MKKKHFLTKILLCFLMAVLFIPSTSQTADAAVNKKQPTKATLTSVKAISYNKVSLKWKKSKNVTSYAVYYKASNSKKWVKIANVSSKKTGYTHKSSKKYPLKQGKVYQYRIRGYNKNAKGNKKWGKYSSVKKVKIPKKAAAKPTEAPKPTVKPTEAPKPTAVPQPTKAPQPTVTPRPTATLAPTATPKPVKVSSITLNQTSLTMTSKGQTASLTATVSPGNAANKSITWSSSNSSVATVNANGTVTAIANGTADITATAADGSGVSAKCSVTVRVPNNVRNITLEGGKSKAIGPDIDDFDNIDFKQVAFDIKNDNNSINILGLHATEYAAGVTVKGLIHGTAIIVAKYNRNVLLTYNITVTSDWKEYLGYASWKKTVESQIWTNSMALKDKLDAAQNYIKTHFKYKNGAPQYVYAYAEGIADCFTASDFFGDFAKDAGAQVKYVSTHTGNMYDYIADAVSDGGHVFNRVLLNGQWVNYDAQPPLS